MTIELGIIDIDALEPRTAEEDAAEEAWHAWRAGGVTASEIAAAYTRSYGKTPRSVIAQKLGKIPAEIPTAEMARKWAFGHAMEAPIGAAVTALTGYHIAGEQSWCEHPTESWMRATVDGFALADPADELAEARGLLECKTTTSQSPSWATYEAQAQWQLAVTGLELAIIAVWQYRHRPGKPWRRQLILEPVTADPTVQAELIELGADIWHHTNAGTLPAAA